jgi:hypothetical protein
MTNIYAQLGEPLASGVIGALIELTALARKASWAATEHLDSVANDLLTCVALTRQHMAQSGIVTVL